LYDPPGEVVYIRGRCGLRGVHEPLDGIHVVTVGGSTTDQRFITEGQTWQDVIRQQSGMAVANAGVDGMSSMGHIVAVTEWLHKLPRFRPRFYLHYIGINDALLSPVPLVGDRSGLSSWTRRLRSRSVIAHSLSQWWDYVRGPVLVMHGQVRAADWSKFELTEAMVDRSKVRAYINDVFKPNLHVLLELHRQNHERAIIVSQPLHPWAAVYRGDTVLIRVPSVATVAVALPMINRASEQVCHEQSDICRFVDLAQQLPFEPVDFYDEVHATPTGARKIGRFLARELTVLQKEWR
jgi:hypothetical protein